VVKLRWVILFEFFGFFLCMSDCAMRMIGRRVNGVHGQTLGGRGVDNVVNCASRDDHNISISDNDLTIVSNYFAFTCFKPEKLIDMVVNLLTNVFKWFKGH
jgi:hypothetical protein